MRFTKTDWERYEHAFESIKGLGEVVRRLTQEVEVLKTMLRDRGVWDEPSYKNAIIARLIADHNSTGPAPMCHYSYYPYALEEAAFLQHRFNASDEEIAAFKRDVDYISTLT